MRNLFVLAIILVASTAFAQSNNVHTERYTLTVTGQTQNTVEQAPDACTIATNGGTARTLTADCEMILEGADQIYVSWNTLNSDVTNVTVDWSLNLRCIAEEGDNYVTSGTAPSTTDYHEEDVDLDNEVGGFALTPSPYACKVRFDEDNDGALGTIVKVKASWIKR